MEKLSLVSRIEKYLDRQSRWVEDETKLIEELEISLEGPDPGLDIVLNAVHRAGRQLETLATEHRLLFREWNNAQEVDPAERLALETRYARHAEAVSALASRHEALLNTIEARTQQNQQQLAEMTRGRAILRGYRSGMDNEPGFVDQKS